MGAISARKAIKVTENVLYVIAIELIAAAQGLDLQEKRRLGRGTQLVYDFVREYIPFLDRDRVLSDDIIKLKELLSQGALSQVWQQVQEV